MGRLVDLKEENITIGNFSTYKIKCWVSAASVLDRNYFLSFQK